MLSNQLIQIALSLMALFIVPLLSAQLYRLLRLAADRLHISFSTEQEQQLRRLTDDAVRAAEEYAVSKIALGHTVTSDEKLNYAVDHLQSNLTGVDGGTAVKMIKAALPRLGFGAVGKVFKKIAGAVTVVLLCVSAVYAQDHSADVAQAKADLQRAGVDISGACGAAKITNLVAWRLRPQYGMLGKLGGFRAVLRPDGSCESGGAPGDSTRDAGVASDYLIERGTWHGYDLLGDGGGRNDPHWMLDAKPDGSEDAGELSRNANNFISAFDPATYMLGALPPIALPPITTPQPIVLDLSGVQTQLAQIAAQLDTLTKSDDDAHKSINQNVSDGRAENRGFFSSVAEHWKAITAIAGPFITYGTCRVTGKCGS